MNFGFGPGGIRIGMGGGGYADPSGGGFRPQGMGGMGGGMPGVAFPQGVSMNSSINSPGGALSRLLGGAGERIGGATDWLTDKDQGSNRIALLMGLANLGTGLYAAHEQGKREDQQYEQSQEDRQRKVDAANAAAPTEQAILDMLMKQYKGG